MIHFKSVVPSMHQYLVPFDGGYTVGELNSFYGGYLARCMKGKAQELSSSGKKEIFESFREWLKMGRMIFRKGGKDIPIFFYVNLSDGRSLAFKPVLDHTVCPIDFMIGAKVNGQLRRTAIVNLTKKVESSLEFSRTLDEIQPAATKVEYQRSVPKIDYNSFNPDDESYRKWSEIYDRIEEMDCAGYTLESPRVKRV